MNKHRTGIILDAAITVAFLIGLGVLALGAASSLVLPSSTKFFLVGGVAIVVLMLLLIIIRIISMAYDDLKKRGA